MAEPLTTTPDVETALLRSLTPSESALMDNVIAQASARLRTAMGSIDQRIAAFQADPTDRAGIDPVVVAGVLANVIRRAMIATDGATTVAETTGPFTRSKTFDSRKANEVLGVLAITADDLAQLVGVKGRVLPRSAKLRPAILEDYR